jgi:hypothetical protein
MMGAGATDEQHCSLALRAWIYFLYRSFNRRHFFGNNRFNPVYELLIVKISSYFPEGLGSRFCADEV